MKDYKKLGKITTWRVEILAELVFLILAINRKNKFRETVFRKIWWSFNLKK